MKKEKTISTRLEEYLLEATEKRALQDDVPVGHIVRQALREFLHIPIKMEVE